MRQRPHLRFAKTAHLLRPLYCARVGCRRRDRRVDPDVSIKLTYVCSCRMPVFLYNYSDRTMHGIFKAVSNGSLEINPKGLSTNLTSHFPFDILLIHEC